MTASPQLPLLDAVGFEPLAGGRVSLAVEVVAELRRSLRDDEVGALLRVRLAGGRTVLCTGPDVPQRQVGATLHVDGYWDVLPRGGLVLRVEQLRQVQRPNEIRAVAQYLRVNIPGLGRVRAERLAKGLGQNALSQLAERPGIARDLFPGGTGEQITVALSRWAAEQARDSVAQQLTARLTSAGVRYGTVRRIVRYFSTGDAAAVVALRHPYRLIEVPGVGWRIADTIAQRLGVPENDPRRYLAACQMVLSEAPRQGHTGLPAAIIERRAARLLCCSRTSSELRAAVGRLLSDGHAVDSAGLVGLPDEVATEAEMSDRIAALLQRPRGLSSAEDATVSRVISASGLSADQQAAAWNCLRHSCSVLTGRPGAGKTTTLKTLVACADALGWRVQIVAPTGKAASRAAAVTRASASTVHRLLAGQPMDAPTPIPVDLVVVDEASMCDIETAAWLLRAVSPSAGTRIVWCGDADQLPSVGNGQVLADLISSDVVPTSRLTAVFRQATDSRIVTNAHRLLDHQPLLLADAPGWRYVSLDRYSQPLDTAVLAELRRLLAEGFAVDDVQVLAPMRRGALGVELLNQELQAILNPNGAVGPFVGGGVRARVGDRVVVTRNMYDLPKPLFNGEQGTVVGADRRGVLRLRVDDREVALAGVQCLMVRLAWAMTVHRAQGSEYPAVILAYHDRAHGPMLDWRLLYTAITRGRRHVSLVGTSAALTQTAQRASGSARHTTLAWQLSSLIPNVVKDS